MSATAYIVDGEYRSDPRLPIAPGAGDDNKVLAYDHATGSFELVASPPPGGAAGGALGGSFPNPDLAASVAGNGLGFAANVLSVNVDGSTLELSGDAVRVKDGGITNAKIAAGAGIPYSKLSLTSTIQVGDLAFDVATQGELDASALLALIKAPADAARNTIQPSADVPALTLKARAAGQTSSLLEVRDDASTLAARIVVDDPITVGSGGNARLDFPAMGSGHGPVNVNAWSVTFASVVDPCIGVTYNYGGSGGSPVVAGESMAGWIIEGDYNRSGTRVMEAYCEGVNNATTRSARPFFASFLKNATTAETLLETSVWSAGTLGATVRWHRDAGDLDMANFSPNYLTVYAPDTAQNTTLDLRAAASRASQVNLGYGGTAGVWGWTTVSTTRMKLHDPATGLGFNLYKFGNSVTAAIGIDDNVSMLTLGNSTGNNGVQVLRLQGKNGQTANLLTIDRDTGSVATCISVNAAGNLVFAEGFNIDVGTGTGTKIGAGAGRRLGFFNATPVVQPAGVADASTAHALNAIYVDTEVEAALNALGSKLNAVVANLEALGLQTAA